MGTRPQQGICQMRYSFESRRKLVTQLDGYRRSFFLRRYGTAQRVANVPECEFTSSQSLSSWGNEVCGLVYMPVWTNGDPEGDVHGDSLVVDHLSPQPAQPGRGGLFLPATAHERQLPLLRAGSARTSPARPMVRRCRRQPALRPRRQRRSWLPRPRIRRTPRLDDGVFAERPGRFQVLDDTRPGSVWGGSDARRRIALGNTVKVPAGMPAALRVRGDRGESDIAGRRWTGCSRRR